MFFPAIVIGLDVSLICDAGPYCLGVTVTCTCRTKQPVLVWNVTHLINSSFDNSADNELDFHGMDDIGDQKNRTVDGVLYIATLTAINYSDTPRSLEAILTFTTQSILKNRSIYCYEGYYNEQQMYSIHLLGEFFYKY